MNAGIDHDEVVLLPRSERIRASAILERAFAQDAMWMALLPDAEARERALPVMWKAVVAYCQTYGIVHTTAGREGVACWAAPGREQTTVWRTLRAGGLFIRFAMSLPAGSRRRLLDALAWMDACHRQAMPEPHGYLWALGVDPAYQGRGIGSRLLVPGLELADRASVPCYLETQTESNVAFYRRRGFTVLSEDDVPGFGVHLWMMRRDSREPVGTA